MTHFIVEIYNFQIDVYCEAVKILTPIKLFVLKVF